MNMYTATFLGAPPITDIPTDGLRRDGGTEPRAEHRSPIGAASAHETLVALCALLHRFTGHDDVLVAIPRTVSTSGVVRSRMDPESTISTFREYLADEITAAGHRDSLPLSDVVTYPVTDLLNPDTGLHAAAPRLNVAFLNDQALHEIATLFEISVRFELGNAIWNYDASLFATSTIHRWGEHLERMLVAIEGSVDALDDSSMLLSSVELLSPNQRRQVVVEWNDTANTFRENARVHEIIETQVARNPEATAVEFGDTSLSYAELELKANALANHLIALGVAPQTLVGVHLERGIEMLPALLAILKAGCGYVPLDPGFPADRLGFMIQDSGLTTLLTQSSLRGSLTTPAPINVIELDTESQAIAAAGSQRPAVHGHSRDLMYVIYTSGSTGTPKGVELEHRSVVNFLETMSREPGIAATDRLLAVTTLSFDIAGLELFLPLTIGATVVIAPSAMTSDPTALIDAIEQQQITIMQATPATWRLLIEAGWSGNEQIKVLCGGEALPPSLASALVSRVGELWNMYGPTETTIWSTIQQVRNNEPLTIGRPIANTTLYVLDSSSLPVPIGVAGELFIGGDGLARGYHNRPELTEQRFVADPFSEQPEARLYRTGDLARYRADGQIEFLGRVDQQVKVRGFRIELGEIETVLSRHPAVEDTVVLAREDPSGEKRLVAYVVLRDAFRNPMGRGTATEDVVSATSLRRTVQAALPRYMVPSLVEFLETMPQTPNGKTDRNGLADPDWALATRDTPYVAPRDETEITMSRLWESELGIDRVGIHDDFFDLGVESLVAARLFAKIETTFSITLPLGTIFADPTVAGLSALIRTDGNAKSQYASLVSMQPNGNQPPWFGIHGGAGTVLLFSDLARRLQQHDQPFYALQAQGLYGHDPVHTRIPEMATAYVAQIREVQPHGPYVLLGYCFGMFVAYEMAQQLVAAGEAVDVVASINGPDLGYIHRHDPDNLLGLNDDDSQRVPQPKQPLKVRMRKFLSKRVRNAQFEYALRFHRPMPEVLRENNRFQLIAMRSQFHYTAKPYPGNVLVFRANGLYAEADLGWSESAGHSVKVLEVPGHQPVPRSTMKEPVVAFIADQLLATVREIRRQ